MTPYQYGANNPMKFVDINGDSLKLNFIGRYAQHAKGKLDGIINRTLEGQFRVSYRDVTYDDDNEIASGTMEIIPTDGGGDISKMSLNGQEFYRELTSVVNDKGTITEMDVDYARSDISTGNFNKSTIDVADILQFNENISDLGGTQAGKIIHEVREQYSKQVLKNNDFRSAHRAAIQAENNVNLSTRSDRGATQIFTGNGGRKVSNTILFENRRIIKIIRKNE